MSKEKKVMGEFYYIKIMWDPDPGFFFSRVGSGVFSSRIRIQVKSALIHNSVSMVKLI